MRCRWLRAKHHENYRKRVENNKCLCYNNTRCACIMAKKRVLPDWNAKMCSKPDEEEVYLK